MSIRQKAGLLLLLLFGAGAVWLYWEKGEPRRVALTALASFSGSLRENDSSALLQTVVLPAAIQGRTTAEQFEFLQKALRDEISPEGLAALRRDGTFGSLTNIFPTEAARWSTSAGVKLDDCVAFKMERNGIRAEVVLVKESKPESPNPAFRVVRCNNVKQMAAAKL